MAEDGHPNDNQRVSVSLAQLRAELTALELRLVDRLNIALANKADRVSVEELMVRFSDVQSRISVLEQRAIVRDGPQAAKIEKLEQEVGNLLSLAGYKRWLWAQTVALVGIAVPLAAFFIENWFGK
jgi:GTPase involved in cell partitioning and DNA repair